MAKVDNSVKIAGMIVGVILIIAVLGFWFFSNSVNEQTLTSNGVASVKVVPDVVSVYFSVETNGANASGAKDANAEIVDSVVSGLMGVGISREKIETQSFNVYEDFDYSEKGRKSLGFKAVHSLKIGLFSDGNVGEVIDVGVDNGARLSYINFELSRELENQYKAKALKLAAEDARVKAEAIADGLGARLGDVVSTSSSEFDYYPFLAYSSEDGVAVKGAEIETEIVPSEREVSARVSVVFEIG